MKTITVASLVIGGLTLTACQSEHHHTFVETLGTDTLTIERYVHTGDFIEGDVIVRNPVTRVARYRADLGADGIERLEVSWSTPAENPDGPEAEHSVITIGPDSVTMVKEGGRNPGTLTLPREGQILPRVGVSPISLGLFEYLVQRAAEAGEDEYPYRLMTAGSPRVAPNAVTRVSADTVSMSYFGNPMKMSVSDGHISGMTGEATTMKVSAATTTDVFDLAALAADFAARDARGEGLGVPSPGATLQASVGGANFEIVYSQPAVRGREIFGSLVPWNEIWRTGANAATIFTTDRNLTIGGEPVPAGSYTLWSTYSPEQGTLIINSQTGQWGTQYDESQDFIRIPMELSTTEEPYERFTFVIEEDDDGPILSLNWDHSRYWVPMAVR